MAGRRRGVVIAAVILVLVGAGPVAGAELPPAFPDGDWHGTSVYGGQIDGEGVSAAANGDVVFDLTVTDGVVDGTLAIESFQTGISATGTSEFTLSGTLVLGGTGEVVEFTGPVAMEGSASSGGFTVPIDYSGTSDGTLSPSFASCNQVTGDLATQARDIQQGAGFATGVTGLFVAFRTGGSAGGAEELIAEYPNLVDAIVDLVNSATPSPQDVLELVKRYEALAALVAGLGACGAAPPGFESGLSDKLIGALFQDLLQKALDQPGAYSVQALLSLLGSGVRMGAVGVAVPGTGAYQDVAESLLVQFEATLSAKLDEAAASGDTSAILDILVAAQQYGLGGLAAKAKTMLPGAT